MKDKYNLFVIILSTTSIYLSWDFLLKIETDKCNIIFVPIFGVLSSYSIYKGFTTILHSTAKKIESINQFFLGNEYLNGTWIGFYKGTSGKVRYIVERYEQTLEKIKIRGHSYDEEMNVHSTWNSTSIQIDSESGKIIYTYTVTGLDENTNGTGIAEFDFERKSKRKHPLIIQGYSSDIHVGQRVRSYEKKITKKELLASEEMLIVTEAKRVYEEYLRPQKPDISY